MNKTVAAIALDMRVASGHVWFDKIAGSALVPRPLRRLLWRVGGVDTQTMNIFPGVTVTGHRVHVGAGTFLNRGVWLDAGQGRIHIGEDCMLSPAVMILTATHELVDGAPSHQAINRDVTIGDRVWLGARCTILPGVTIGEGCVIAAGAVVNRDCQPHTLYAGVPARSIRHLVPDSRSPRSGS